MVNFCLTKAMGDGGTRDSRFSVSVAAGQGGIACSEADGATEPRPCGPAALALANTNYTGSGGNTNSTGSGGANTNTGSGANNDMDPSANNYTGSGANNDMDPSANNYMDSSANNDMDSSANNVDSSANNMDSSANNVDSSANNVDSSANNYMDPADVLAATANARCVPTRCEARLPIQRLPNRGTVYGFFPIENVSLCFSLKVFGRQYPPTGSV